MPSMEQKTDGTEGRLAATSSNPHDHLLRRPLLLGPALLLRGRDARSGFGTQVTRFARPALISPECEGSCRVRNTTFDACQQTARLLQSADLLVESSNNFV
jgi:hypothetical protein